MFVRSTIVCGFSLARLTCASRCRLSNDHGRAACAFATSKWGAEYPRQITFALRQDQSHSLR